MKGAKAVALCLKEQGVDTVFGYPGGMILPLYDAFYENPAIREILVTHEQNAAHAADGYARASGKVGVCIATSGPGATNLVTGLATAFMDSVPVVAITGSNGKTPTKDLTAAVLSARGPVLKTQANYNNEIGLPLTLLGLRKEHTAAVVEIGMRGLHQIEAMAPIAAPTVGIVTNVGETHMELLGSIENIAKAKSEMVEAIPAGGTVVLNADNPYVAAMRSQAKEGVRVLTFGIEKEADVRAKEETIETIDGHETRFKIEWKGREQTFTFAMVGRHNVYNALAAIAAGFALGLTPAEAASGLRNLKATKMRFEVQDVKTYHVINDAYNASPMSMKAAIETLSELTKGRKIAVMGDMLELGSVSEEAHREVGHELAEHGFAAVVTRGQMGAFIADGAEEGGVPQVFRADSHEAAADYLHKILEPGDTILFKGSRGMQMEKIIDLL